MCLCFIFQKLKTLDVEVNELHSHFKNKTLYTVKYVSPREKEITGVIVGVFLYSSESFQEFRL